MTDLGDLERCTFFVSRPSTDEVRGRMWMWMCQDGEVRARSRAYAGCGYACDDETGAA